MKVDTRDQRAPHFADMTSEQQTKPWERQSELPTGVRGPGTRMCYHVNYTYVGILKSVYFLSFSQGVP